MIKIKINASDEIREVTFSRRSEHVIELGGITDAPTTGFTTWRMDGVTQLGDFSDYTTVYRTLDNAVQLSDDGSVYVEPEVPEPGEPQPTQEERIKALEDQNETLLQCILEMSGKEEDMMAMIWAQQIMLGKKIFAQVPRLLKEKVKEVLIDSGCEDLVTE